MHSRRLELEDFGEPFVAGLYATKRQIVYNVQKLKFEPFMSLRYDFPKPDE